MSALPAKHFFNREEWQRLGKVGFFPPEYRAELVAGEIIDMSPIGELHSGCVDWLNHFFSGQLFGQVIIRVQNPLKLGDFSAPQPDITILRYQSHFYRNSAPSAEDVLLLIEVADTSVQYDRNTKGLLYARFGIPEYWLVNLVTNCVEVYRNPQSNGYADQRVLKLGDILKTVKLTGIEVKVSDILGL
jgi:Uma2 family endonuclease